MTGSSPRAIAWDDDSTIVLTSKAEAKLLLNTVDAMFTRFYDQYDRMIGQGMPEWHPLACDTREVLWGHAAVLRKLCLIYGSMHYDSCNDHEECALGTPEKISTTRDQFRNVMGQLEKIDADVNAGGAPSSEFRMALKNFIQILRGE